MTSYVERQAIEKLDKFIEYLEEQECDIIANDLIKGMQEKAILNDIQTDLVECREIIRDIANG